MQSPQSVSKRPRDEENTPEQNLTVDEILNSYANANSEDDSDFVPNPEDDSDSSASDSDSESRSSDDISSSEVQENAEEVSDHRIDLQSIDQSIIDTELQHERIVKNGVHQSTATATTTEKPAEQHNKLDKTKTMSTNSNGNADDNKSKEQKDVGNGH